MSSCVLCCPLHKSEHQPICLFRKSSNISRKVSWPVVGTAGQFRFRSGLTPACTYFLKSTVASKAHSLRIIVGIYSVAPATEGVNSLPFCLPMLWCSALVLSPPLLVGCHPSPSQTLRGESSILLRFTCSVGLERQRHMVATVRVFGECLLWPRPE